MKEPGLHSRKIYLPAELFLLIAILKPNVCVGGVSHTNQFSNVPDTNWAFNNSVLF